MYHFSISTKGLLRMSPVSAEAQVVCCSSDQLVLLVFHLFQCLHRGLDLIWSRCSFLKLLVALLNFLIPVENLAWHSHCYRGSLITTNVWENFQERLSLHLWLPEWLHLQTTCLSREASLTLLSSECTHVQGYTSQQSSLALVHSASGNRNFHSTASLKSVFERWSSDFFGFVSKFCLKRGGWKGDL